MNTEFERRVQTFYELRDKWIDRIEARLHDLTGLKLAVDSRFSYPLVSSNEDNVAINKGKKTVVSLPTDGIAACIGRDKLRRLLHRGFGYYWLGVTCLQKACNDLQLSVN